MTMMNAASVDLLKVIMQKFPHAIRR